MFTIHELVSYEQIINKSRFICYLFPINDLNDVKENLNNIRKKHYDATHNCYSYIIGTNNQIIKNSDDGEPSRTAGVIIYDVLTKNNLTNILAIVTRYYGGIKLGAGGLIRAYGSSVARAVEISQFIKIEKKSKLMLEFDYAQLNVISKLINNYPELNKSYNQKINILILVPDDSIQTLCDNLINTTKNNINIQVIN